MAAASKRTRLNGFINRIRLVGVELEGGWDNVPVGEDIARDGSVKFEPTQADVLLQQEQLRAWEVMATNMLSQGVPRNRIPPNPPPAPGRQPRYKGEIVSRPMPLDSVARWMTHAFPQHVNDTCGLHVHMSFYHKINYSRLMTPDYTAFMVGKVRAWAESEGLDPEHPQWARLLRPDHRHCAHQYNGPEQVKATKKDYESRGKPHNRYTFVNYCHTQHKTVEVRGLAMFATAEQGIRAVMMVLTATNEFLSKLRERERPERVSLRPRPEPDSHYGSYINAAA